MALSAYKERIFYDAEGHTSNHYYYRFVARHEPYVGYIYDAVLGVLAMAPTWADSSIDMTEDGQTGAFPVLVPQALPSGTYDVIIYHRAGSDPADTDDVENQYTFSKGSIFGF